MRATRFLRIAICLLLSAVATPASAWQEALTDELVRKVDGLVATAESKQLVRSDVEGLFAATVIEYGNVEPLLRWLGDTRLGDTGARGRVLAEIEAHVAARTGDLGRARRVVSKLLEAKDVGSERVDLRLWQAQLLDALGEVDEAKQAYQKLLEDNLADQDQRLVRLRLALMGLLGAGQSDAKPLIELAEKSEDPAFRNRAANVLAVQNKYKDAVKLFRVEGEGTERFRSASRLCEWAIRAADRDRAIETAWDAVGSAQIRRDRRYALALLVEAYRLKEEKKGLATLVDEFEKRDGNDMPAEMRTVWISLLRELERYDAAIALFRASAGEESGFSVEMRRELLEMQGQAGKTDEMIASYRSLIAAEPNQMHWRGGLTRVLLEQGKKDAALALWSKYVPELREGPMLLNAARTLGELGLDEQASAAVERMVTLKADHGQGLLYLSDLQHSRGRLDECEETLNRLNQISEAGDAVRFELAAAFERVGRQDKAVEVIEGLRESRTEVATDLEMRLAWLYSEIGEEDKAMKQWLALWKETKSIPRRRYVEDRLMTVASRLGTLGDIAVDLEVKLMDGKADDREAGLLTRIYSRVNDSVAASEVLEEYMTQAGRREVERLQEKARIYQVCNDYWNYEKVIEQLIEVDPEGRTDYLRQLALSMLERGKAQDARKVLLKLRDQDDGKDNIGGEFEAGVLSLVGLRPEAADAYRKGIATYPDRIESYLLLANLLRDMGEVERAVGMFQYLAENADQDDLFTIAIDGLLNMEAPPKVMQWARRITLQRLAARDDKNYLYQLLADLSAEVNDKNGQIRALENSLAVSGTRRLSVLRECMDLSSRIRGGVFYSTASRGPTNAGNKPFFAYGRRLIGLGELMPPQVFLDLGQAFLDDGDVASAERTFAMARNHADERGYERDVARIFETAGRRPESLSRYDKLLRTSPSDVALIARVAKLHEQEGRDDTASTFYRRGLNLLFSQTPLTTLEEASGDETAFVWAQNQDAYDKYAEQLLRGILVTLPDSDVDEFVGAQRGLIDATLEALRNSRDKGRRADRLDEAPRLARRTTALRRVCFAFDRLKPMRDMDMALIKQFPEDADLIVKLVSERVSRGELSSAADLITSTNASDDVRRRFSGVPGVAVDEGPATGRLAPAEMWQQLLPLWTAGDRPGALRVLRRLDQTKITGTEPGQTVIYVYANGQPEYKQAWASDVFVLAQLARTLGDDGLAMQFARSRIQNTAVVTGSVLGDPSISLLKGLRTVLPRESFDSVARFAMNKFADDDKHGLAYLWLVAQFKDANLSDDELLSKLDELDIGLDYFRFTFKEAAEIFPESTLTDALERLVENTDPKMVAGPLATIPFLHPEPLSDDVAQIVIDGVQKGIVDAMKENFLSYATSNLPGGYTQPGQADPLILMNTANAECAIAVLDAFSTDDLQNSELAIANRARGLKALVLNQLGRTEEAVDLALAIYDPARQVTDYYERYTWQRVEREILPLAPEKFLAKASVQSGEKPTVQETDKRLTLLRGLKDDGLLRAEYERAWKNHPTQSKYPQQYRLWEQRAGRTMNVLAIDERVLAETRAKSEEKKDGKPAPQSAAARSRLSSLHRQLAQQWDSVSHPVKALEHWIVQDDADIKRFESEKARRASATKPKTNPTPPTKSGAQPVRPGAPAARMTPARPVGTATRAALVVPPRVAAARANRPKTITDVKKAVDAKKFDEAASILRGLWRAFPPVVDTPYRVFRSPTLLNTMRWPAARRPSTTGPKPEPPDKAAIEAARRRRLRGGLATLDDPPNAVATRVQPPSAWSALADHPFGVAEMRRLLRSRSASELDAASEVVLGLLKADRAERGDQAVFDSLLSGIRDGRAGQVQTIQLMALVEDKPELLGDDGGQIVNELTTLLRLDRAELAVKLAKLCAATDQSNRAAALFTHCATRASDRDIYRTGMNVTFQQLVDDAEGTFEGEELFDVVERMFAAAPVKSDPAVEAVLELRHTHLSPAEAADRSEAFFAALDANPSAVRAAAAIWGARLFAEAGRLERARQCLECVVRRLATPPDRYGRITPEKRLTRAEFLRLFPADASRFKDYPAWLSLAASEIQKLRNARLLSASMSVEMTAIIAHRLHQAGDTGKARTIAVEMVNREQQIERRLQPLVIDVLRETGLTADALNLQRKLYEAGELSHVRFGDLLTDAATVDGADAAKKLLAELGRKTLDADLLTAAETVASEDGTRLKESADKAKAEREKRQAAAAERAKTRSEWAKAAAAAAAKAKEEAKEKSDKAAKPDPKK